MINSPTLAGQHILVTRPGEKGENLAAILEQHGAIACRFPLFEIVLQPDPSAFQTQWQSLNAVAIIIFVSIPSVDGFFDSKGMTRDRLFADFPEIAVAAVGPGTAQRLGEFEWKQTIYLHLVSTAKVYSRDSKMHSLKVNKWLSYAVATGARPSLKAFLAEAPGLAICSPMIDG